MPKQKNILQFSVPQDTLNQLENLRQDGESISTCAKRLLLNYLEGEVPDTSEINQKFDQVLRAIENLRESPAGKNPPVLEKKATEQNEISELKQELQKMMERIAESEKSVNTHDQIFDEDTKSVEAGDKFSDSDEADQKVITDFEASKILGASVTTVRNLRLGKTSPKWLKKIEAVGLTIVDRQWVKKK